MTVSRGDAFVFYSSVKVCLEEVQRLLDSGKADPWDLKRTVAELSCMKAVLERNKD